MDIRRLREVIEMLTATVELHTGNGARSQPVDWPRATNGEDIDHDAVAKQGRKAMRELMDGYMLVKDAEWTPAREEFLRDVLCTAFEGGSTYWAQAKAVKRGADLSYISFDVRPLEPEDRKDPSNDRMKTWQHINTTKIDEAIKGVLSGQHKVGSHIAQMFVGYPHNLDGIDYDADGADVMLQLAAFGEIIYG